MHGSFPALLPCSFPSHSYKMSSIRFDSPSSLNTQQSLMVYMSLTFRKTKTSPPFMRMCANVKSPLKGAKVMSDRRKALNVTGDVTPQLLRADGKLMATDKTCLASISPLNSCFYKV